MSYKRKKVLFLITKSNWGGAQRYVYDLATHLDKSKFEPVVALGGNGDLVTLLKHADIRVINISSLNRDISTRQDLTFIKELWQMIRQEKPDVLHVNSSKAGGVGALVGRLCLVPKVIFTAHGWAFNEDRPWWQKKIIKFLHWITVILSHRTIAVSKATVTQMNWPFTQHKFKILHPGRTIGPMYEKAEARDKLAEHHSLLASFTDDVWILTIAELHPVKRLAVLIEAMKKLTAVKPQLRCVIIGDGELKEKLDHLINKNQLQENIFLLGAITEAARFLKAGDIFVLPSKSESYGYVLHEAGLAGLPVIATNVGGIPDIITDRKTGRLIPTDDSNAIADAVHEYLNKTDIWKQYAAALRSEMRERTVEKMAAATSDLYLLS